MITLALSKEEFRRGATVAGAAVSRRSRSEASRTDHRTPTKRRIVVVRASTYLPTFNMARTRVASGFASNRRHWGDRGLYQPVDLGIARCRLCVAVPAGFDYANAVRRGARLRVATKYVQTAREHFAAKGVHVDLIKLYGSMELAPLAGLADVIVDLVSSGSTLKANKLVEVEEVAFISARLIVTSRAKIRRED